MRRQWGQPYPESAVCKSELRLFFLSAGERYRPSGQNGPADFLRERGRYGVTVTSDPYVRYGQAWAAAASGSSTQPRLCGKP